MAKIIFDENTDYDFVKNLCDRIISDTLSHNLDFSSQQRDELQMARIYLRGAEEAKSNSETYRYQSFVKASYLILYPFSQYTEATGSGSQVVIQWGYFNSDQFPLISSGVVPEFQYSMKANFNTTSLILEFTDQAEYKYLAIRYPSNMPNMTSYINGDTNSGTIPDTVFMEILSIDGYKYITTRLPFVFNINNKITFRNDI